MLAKILYPDSCSAPPWTTLTPHTLLQLLLGLRIESLKRLLLEQTPFGNFWPVMMLLSLQLWLQGQCHPNSPWGKGLRASLTQQLWSLLCGLLLHWAGLSSPHTPSSPCCCHSSTPQGEAAHLQEKQLKRSQQEPCKGQRSMVVCHQPQQLTSCRLLLPLMVIHALSQSLPNPRHPAEAAAFVCWDLQLPSSPVSLYFLSLQSSSALIQYFDKYIPSIFPAHLP